jgi:hypothetical protein
VARRTGVQRIIYVPFLPPIGTENLGEQVVPEVWSHFRSIKNLDQLGPKVGLRIEVVTEVFDPDQRQDYLSTVGGRLRDRASGCRLVLLDPDTGIAPKRATARHVALSEIKEVWAELRLGDWLALYQHARRRPRWLDDTKGELEKALGESIESVYKREVAHDAALLFGEKRGQAA